MPTGSGSMATHRSNTMDNETHSKTEEVDPTAVYRRNNATPKGGGNMMSIEEKREAIAEHTWENTDDKGLRQILREGFEGWDNMSDADVKETFKEIFDEE